MKSIKILFFIALCHVVISYEISPEIYPPQEEFVYNMDIYPYYIFRGNTEKSIEMHIGLRPDLTAYRIYETHEDYLGAWRVVNDTLLIYQDWNISARDNYSERDSMYAWLMSDTTVKYDYRAYYGGLHRRKVTDLSFQRNVSAFRIINHGDFLIGLKDERNMQGVALSKKAAHERHNRLWDYETECFIHSIWEDTLVWKPHKIRQYGIFCIDSIVINKEEPVQIILSKDNLNYTVLNPTMYDNTAASPFRINIQYFGWMDSVRPGDSIALELFRPAYDAEVFERSPYLSASPDTVYVLDGDVYGYWFARPLSTSK